MGLATPDQVPIMVIAIILMMLVSGSISEFVEEHPTVKVLAVAFLILVGVALVADGYLCFAMAFSVALK